MNLEYLANVAEIVGVVLVVVTLVFLTLQIRQNTRALKATTIQAAMRSDMEFASTMLPYAATWDRVLKGEPLKEGEETRQAIILFGNYMTDTENRYHQYKAGYLKAQAWEGRLETVADFVRLPIMEQWRLSPGGRSRSADFLHLLDSLPEDENREIRS